MRRALIASLCIFTFTLASCSSSTNIISHPPGAQVYIAGNYVGNTPLTHSDSKIAGASSTLRIEKEGYEPVNGVIKKNGDANVGAIIAGIFFLIPLFWVVGYPDGYQFELQPIGGQGFAEPAPHYSVVETNPMFEPQVDRNQELRELKNLLDDGILTPEEYEREKAKLLHR